MSKTRISDAVRRDFEFALQCEQELGGLGSKITWPKGDASALMAFKRYDCEGKVVGSSEPEIMVRAMRGKASLNWHIAEWATGIREKLFWLFEFEESHPWLPDWVWTAVRKQAWKLETVAVAVAENSTYTAEELLDALKSAFRGPGERGGYVVDQRTSQASRR